MYKILLCSLMLYFSVPLAASDTSIVQANGITISYETFGSVYSPAFLLINGSIGQGVLWPSAFCQKLADKGYYVIRYDHRGAGRSSFIDFDKTPFDLSDLADDAVGLLTALNIDKAHLFGLSMGGPVAELIAVNYPDRVWSLGLSGGYYDYRPLALKGEGLPLLSDMLSAPTDAYYQGLSEILRMPIETVEDIINQKMATWKLFNGSKYPLDEVECREMFQEFMERTTYPFNVAIYRKAMHLSEQMVLNIHSQVTVPTVIFHGSEDPLIGKDHGEELAKKITGSHYHFLIGMGHLLNPHFYDVIVEQLAKNAH